MGYKMVKLICMLAIAYAITIRTVFVTFTTPLAYSADDNLTMYFFPKKKMGFDISLHANCLLMRHFAWHVKDCFAVTKKEMYFKMSSV